MTYKFLNTIIDDLFAFVIKMPILHRLSGTTSPKRKAPPPDCTSRTFLSTICRLIFMYAQPRGCLDLQQRFAAGRHCPGGEPVAAAAASLAARHG